MAVLLHSHNTELRLWVVEGATPTIMDNLVATLQVDKVRRSIQVRLPGSFADTWQFSIQSFQSELEPTETEFTHDASTAPTLYAPVLHRRGASVLAKSI